MGKESYAMKKILSLLIFGILLMVTTVTSAFAYFTFSDSTTIDNVGTSSDNAKFNEVESDFYKVYFLLLLIMQREQQLMGLKKRIL